ncbi:hypothetical protein PO909_016229 [Leuciscus waleckii]
MAKRSASRVNITSERHTESVVVESYRLGTRDGPAELRESSERTALGSEDACQPADQAELGRTSTSEKRKREQNTLSSCTDSRRDCLTDPGSAQINSHDELPTILSDELLYASVSFQKHEESLSEASVTVSKNELYSDYATVSRRMRLN